MLKHLLMVLLVLSMAVFVGCDDDDDDGCDPITQNVDSISGASVVFYYEESSLTGDDLWDVIQNRTAAFTMATANADGTPNIAICIPGFVDDSTLVFGLADNQTKINLQDRKYGVIAVYKYDPEKEDKFERNIGARIIVEYKEETEEGYLYVTIVRVMPLG